jgi:Multicopper oxidase
VGKLTPGQRYDLVVEADQPIANYYMRLIATAGCSNVVNTDLTAIINYLGAPAGDPTSAPYVPADQICEDETGLVPVVVRDVQPFSYGSGMEITVDQPSLFNDGIFKWDINGSSFRIDWEDPTLLLIDNNEPFPTEYNVLELNGTAATVLPSATSANFSGFTLLFNREVSLPSTIPYVLYLYF